MATAGSASLAPGHQRPGGRTELVRKTVAASVLALIQEGHIDFSYNELAEASGINKTTLYRRWPQRIDLLKEAITEHNATFKIRTGKNWAETAELLVRDLAAFLSKPVEIALNVALIADAGADTYDMMFDLWKPVQTKLNQLITDAQASDDLPRSIGPEAYMRMLISPLLMMTLIHRAPVEKKIISEQIQLVRLMRFAKE